MVFFNKISRLPPDPIFQLTPLFQADTHPGKINLGIGTYRTIEGTAYLLESVKEAEQAIFEQEKEKSYLPIIGDPSFLEAVISLVFGERNPRIAAVQSIGGTGALRLAADLLKPMILYLPHPTWENHARIFQQAGLEVRCISYPYRQEDLEKIPEGSALLFHASCQNPTGIDPTLPEWEALAALCQRRRLLPFFDVAYQGFGGTLDDDVASVRLFAKTGLEMIVAYSFAKNMGLYGERVGMLAIVSDHPQEVLSHLSEQARGTYSTPPLHGARIVTRILTHPETLCHWHEEIKTMHDRTYEMKNTLVAELEVKGAPYDYDQIRMQKGLFCYLDLEEEKVLALRQEKGLYLGPGGRINVTGLHPHNLEAVVDTLS